MYDDLGLRSCHCGVYGVSVEHVDDDRLGTGRLDLVRLGRRPGRAHDVMAGRDDSRQKGYDVLARAAELFLERQGKARFLFFPIPGDEGRAGLEFLRELAEQYPQSVLAFPFLFREGFLGALRGATARFRERVELAERLAADAGETWAELDLDGQERWYEAAKAALAGRSGG